MTETESMDDKNFSDTIICPRCGTVLPPQANFCSSCSEKIKNEERKAHTENGDDDAQGDTVHIPSLSKAHQQGLQLGRSPGSDATAGQRYTRSLLLQDVEAPLSVGVTAPPISRQAGTWGWFPELSLISAVGVFLIALAYEGGRLAAQHWPEPLYWSGLLVLFVPIAVRLFSAKPTRQERIALLIVITISFYSVKVLQYPLHFTFYDEFLHVRSAQNIAASDHLFHVNPLLPISAFYPGLEIVTNALSGLTGLSIFWTGIVVIGVALLVLGLSLYLLYEHISNSMQVAGIATLLYMANPSFVAFDTMFAYESLALPLAAFVLFAIVRRSYVPANQRLGLTLLTWTGLMAVVVTHHLTSFALLAFLFMWTIVFLLLRQVALFRSNRNQKVQVGPREAALAACVLTILWLMYTDWQAVAYMAPHLTTTVNQAVQILAHQKAPRQLFHSNTSSSVSPLWERIAAYASEVLILLGLPFGLFEIWRRLRTNAFAFTVACAALIYPVSLLLHLTQSGAELANRATEFLFVGIAFVLAIGCVQFLLSRSSGWKRMVIVIGAASVIYFGQMVLGSGQPWSLLPGPYLVSADARSIEPEGITAAEWTNTYLGPGHIVASDRDNTLLMATFGNQVAETAGSAAIPVSSLFLSLRFGPNTEKIIQQDSIQYLVVDLRLSTALPAIGTYFNSANTQPTTTPISRAALTKFDGVPNVSRIFDSGDIIIYNVEAITNGPPITSTPKHFHPTRPRPFKPALPKLPQLEAWVRRSSSLSLLSP